MLPVEVVVDIIRMATNIDDCHPMSWQAIKEVVKFSHLDAFLRQVVIQTPQLWTTIRIDSFHPKAFELAVFSLQRSKSLPLALVVHLWENGRNVVMVEAAQALHIISSACGRIRDFDLFIDDPITLMVFQVEASKFEMPILSSLDIGCDCDGIGIPRCAEVRFPSAPSLRSLTLSHTTPSRLSALGTVTTLTLCACSINLIPLDDLSEIISACDQLESLKYDEGNSTWNVDPNFGWTSAVICPKLTSLSVNSPDAEFLVTLFAKLEAPRLRSVYIRDPCKYWELDGADDIGVGAFPMVSTLAIVPTYQRSVIEELVEFLAPRLPNVATMRIPASGVELLQRVHLPLWSKMELLEIVVDKRTLTSQLDVHSILNFVHTRPAVAHIALNYPTGRIRDMERFAEAIEEGLEGRPAKLTHRFTNENIRY